MNVAAIFAIFLRLGLTSFGGPVAHLGYFRNEFVVRRGWFGEAAYADLVALCQFLPGPASSQVGIAIGHTRAGLAGALAAWIGFTLPSALLMVLFGYGVEAFGGAAGGGWLHGLKLVAVAIVAQAIWGMGRQLAADKARASIAAGACLVASLWPDSFGQVGAIAAAGLLGWAWLKSAPPPVPEAAAPEGRRAPGAAWLALFALLLLGLPLAAAAWPSYPLELFDRLYRAGALVFGGGHVVLPLLRAEVVPAGWVGDARFMAGYGAAQALPGPLFSFAAFLGTVSGGSPAGWAGAALALVAIFLPGFLLVVGALPFWHRLARVAGTRRAMQGINAAVVGLLLAAFFDPVWTSAVRRPADFCAAVIAFVALQFWKMPPWLIVFLAAGSGAAIAT